MDENLRVALQLLIKKDDEGGLFDRQADMETWRSEELEKALDVIRAALEMAALTVAGGSGSNWRHPRAAGKIRKSAGKTSAKGADQERQLLR